MASTSKFALNTNTCAIENIHEESRLYPRVVLMTSVEVMRIKGAVVKALLVDISPDAVQIRCSRSAAFCLHPSARFIQPENGSEVLLKVKLPQYQGATEIVLRCRMTYFTQGHDGNVTFGLRFEDLGDNRSKIIEQFIEQSLRFEETIAEELTFDEVVVM